MSTVSSGQKYSFDYSFCWSAFYFLSVLLSQQNTFYHPQIVDMHFNQIICMRTWDTKSLSDLSYICIYKYTTEVKNEASVLNTESSVVKRKSQPHFNYIFLNWKFKRNHESSSFCSSCNTNDTLFTGIKYAVKARLSQKYLDGSSADGMSMLFR